MTTKTEPEKASLPPMPDVDAPTAKSWPKQSEVASFFGRIEIGNNGRPTERWESSALTLINLPFGMRLSWEPERTVRRLTCHRGVARDLSQILGEILEHYGSAEAVQAARMDLFGGCYNFRRMRGGAALSMHSYGIAIDLDPEQNEMGEPWRPDAGMMPEPVIEIFERHGWTWGGRWTGRDCDPMHFQAARSKPDGRR